MTNKKSDINLKNRAINRLFYARSEASAYISFYIAKAVVLRNRWNSKKQYLFNNQQTKICHILQTATAGENEQAIKIQI
jgi:hypothetical protein